MRQLTIEHLAPYLPYGLKIELLREGYRGIYTEYSIRTYSDYPISIGVSGQVTYGAMLSEIKPILRPLSDLTKEIEHNGEKFVPIEWLEDKYYTLDFGFQCERLLEEDGDNWINQSDYMLVQHLFEWHFDAFGLIEQGLAIDLNKI